MTVREYQSGDKQQIYQLFEVYLEHFVEVDPLSRVVKKPNSVNYFATKMFSEVKDKEGVIYVAEDEDRIVGFVAGILQRQKEEDLLEVVPSLPGRVIELFVTKDYRSQGVGRLLIEKIEGYFKSRGCDVVYIEVFAPNKLAYNFYKNLGYSERVIDLMKQL